MSSHVIELDNNINHTLLYEELCFVINEFNLHDLNQISCTSIDGNNDWLCSIGKIADLQHKERFYSVINKGLENTYISELVSKYSKYYRWRFMKIDPYSTYSVHYDSHSPDQTNVRCHIPIKTNEDSFMIFFGKDKSNKNPVLEHLESGKSYEVNTSHWHSALNFGNHDRWHLIGVSYESRNYWPN